MVSFSGVGTSARLLFAGVCFRCASPGASLLSRPLGAVFGLAGQAETCSWNLPIVDPRMEGPLLAAEGVGAWQEFLSSPEGPSELQKQSRSGLVLF